MQRGCNGQSPKPLRNTEKPLMFCACAREGEIRLSLWECSTGAAVVERAQKHPQKGETGAS
jgi:hypothetical protein